MADTVDKVTRSRMMSGIKGKDTAPELMIRKGLHRRGFRFVLHSRKLPGKPDITLPRYRATIFVNGCFWHGHGCHMATIPSTHSEFWRNKIERNRQRDQETGSALAEAGWRRLIVWECALRGKNRIDFDMLIGMVSDWLLTDSTRTEISGDRSL